MTHVSGGKKKYRNDQMINRILGPRLLKTNRKNEIIRKIYWNRIEVNALWNVNVSIFIPFWWQLIYREIGKRG